MGNTLDKFARHAFLIAPDGRTIFSPPKWGKRNVYVVPDEETYQRLNRRYRSTYVVLFLVIVFGQPLHRIVQPEWLGIIAFGAVALAVVWLSRLVMFGSITRKLERYDKPIDRDFWRRHRLESTDLSTLTLNTLLFSAVGIGIAVYIFVKHDFGAPAFLLLAMNTAATFWCGSQLVQKLRLKTIVSTRGFPVEPVERP